ncbi:MAG: enoyl-CoA hydratase [Burkholderiales bacterium]
MTATLLVERRNHVLLLTISNPEKRNALSHEMYEIGARELKQAAADNAIGAAIILGADGNFCSGGDLSQIAQGRSLPKSHTAEGIEQLHGFINAIKQFPKPVIAAVEGNAAGAGFSIALACDFIVAAENARFSMAYVKVGLSPDGGGTASLAMCLPRQIANELAMEGVTVSTPSLHSLGLINRMTTPGQALTEALNWAQQLAKGPHAAMGRIKQLMHAAYGDGFQAQLNRERDNFVESLHSPDCGEGITAFLQKRAPVFNRD